MTQTRVGFGAERSPEFWVFSCRILTTRRGGQKREQVFRENHILFGYVLLGTFHPSF